VWAEPTAYTYYDPHSLPSDGVATPPWTFNPLVITPRGEADAGADGGDGAAAVGDGAGTSTHAGGGAALALPNPNSTAPTHGETRVVLAGSNFVPAAQLACYFGDEQVRALSPTLTLALALALTLSLSLSLSPNPG
tara:strand:- start:1161 stop:1568 length:408 start_codon:yes stop_codon:yes gene_type:complete